MASIAEQLDRAINAALLAARNKDYVTCRDFIREAYIAYSVTPDAEKDGMQQQLRRIEDLEEKVEKWATEGQPAGSLRMIPVTYAQPGAPEDCTR